MLATQALLLFCQSSLHSIQNVRELEAYNIAVKKMILTPIFLFVESCNRQTTGIGIIMTTKSLNTLIAPTITPKRSAVTLHLFVLSATNHDTPGLGTQRIALPMMVARHWPEIRAMAKAIMSRARGSTLKTSRYNKRTVILARKMAGP